MHKVIQITEEGSRFIVFRGSEDSCSDWIDDNEEDYPESRFYIEPVRYGD